MNQNQQQSDDVTYWTCSICGSIQPDSSDIDFTECRKGHPVFLDWQHQEYPKVYEVDEYGDIIYDTKEGSHG